jgi:hypothetical protein
VEEHSPAPVLPRVERSRLRIGLLVDSAIASKYVHDFAKWAQVQQDLTVTHLILHVPNHTIDRPRNFVAKLLKSIKQQGLRLTLSKVPSKALFQLILNIERIVLSRDSRYKNHLDDFDLSTLVKDQIRVRPILSKSGFVYRFDTEDIRRLRTLNLDLLVRCGSGILRGDILQVARLGVVSFHHADNQINRGGPPGFWEVYLRQDTTGFTLQRLTEELDGGDVLMRGHFQTKYYYLLNQAALFEKSNHYVKQLIKRVANRGRLPTPLPNVPYSNKLFRSPNAYEAALYLIKLFWLLTKKGFRRALRMSYRWEVAYTHSEWKSAVLWRARKLDNPPAHFLADPFVVSKQGKDFCFVEDFDCVKERGSIAVYELRNDRSIRLGTALEENFHLSFPFTFEYQGTLYMCPETSENKDIRIYRCVEFPLRWELEKVIMNSISAVDTVLFEKNGIWWLFTNTDPTGSGDYCSELSIFSSDSPFGNSWRSHCKNPIFVDAARARNAGLIRDGEAYYRISQSQGFDTYGKKVLVNKIVELDDSRYSESTLCEITPTFGKGIVGTHHLHSNGRVTVFDFARSAKNER